MSDKQRVFVLDTSVLLYNAQSTKGFGSATVVIPYVVLEELDKFKTSDDERGRNARIVIRQLNALRSEGRLDSGVQINPEGGSIRVELNFHEGGNPSLDLSRNDDRILNVCLGLAAGGARTTLITKDINLAVRADVLGVDSEDFDSDRPVDTVDEMYTGSAYLTVSDELVSAFYRGETVLGADLPVEVYPNQYLTLVSDQNKSKSALARVSSQTGVLTKLQYQGKEPVWGISPRNREQLFAMDALMDPAIPLVTLTGQAGCGKTLISLACSLELVQERGKYDYLIISRPVQPMGKDLGYLPGDLSAKMDPWMGPIKDALEFLTRGKKQGRDVYQEMLDMRMIELQPLTYIRGRSLPRTLFLIDEASDLSRSEMKTVVSRMGEDSKLILIGDLFQISNPYLHPTTCGLANVVEKFKGYDVAAHLTLSRGERSRLATIASEVL